MPYDMLVQAWDAIFNAIRLPLAGSLDPITANIEGP